MFSSIAIGLSNRNVLLNGFLRDEKCLWWGYHGYYGGCHGPSGSPNVSHAAYGKGDVVGCGLDNKGRIFFTKNGHKQGTVQLLLHLVCLL